MTFTVSWTGSAGWSGPVANINSAAHALSMVGGLTDRGMHNIAIRIVRPDGDWWALPLAELQKLANDETTGPRRAMGH